MRAMLRSLLISGVAVLGMLASAEAQPPALRPVPFSAVTIRDGFWAARQRVNRRKTIPHLVRMCEQGGRVRNMLRAAGRLDGPFEGTRYHDADLFKVIEAASYTLVNNHDPELERKLNQWIDAIAAAQREDGYLHSYAQVRARGTGRRPMKLNLFAAGHLIHAAVAHHDATGKRMLLDVAVRMADLIDSQYGPDATVDVPSHPILESALLRLAQTAGRDRYARQALFFLNERGRAGQSGRRSYGEHAADVVPVRKLDEATGHVIVTLFLLEGMFDAGVRFGDPQLLDACRRVLQDAVTRRMYVTGAMGRQWNERFTAPFALENRTSLGEGCQSRALMELAQRLLLLEADTRYADLIERVLYNNLAANVGLDGTSFYYYNRLAARPEDATGRPYAGIVTETDRSRLPRNCLQRQPWFKVPCCPPNVAIAIATVGQYLYATGPTAVYVNQYMDSETRLTVGEAVLRIRQQTEYPWHGRVQLSVEPEPSPWHGAIHLRIPDWCRELESTGGLYRPLREDAGGQWTVRVNDRAVPPGPLERGYIAIRRVWQAGDRVELSLPLPIRRIVADQRVAADRGRAALQRGPVVYCVEAADHGGRTRDLLLPADAMLRAEHRPDWLGGVTVLRGTAFRQTASGQPRPLPLLAVPYAVWANRQAGEMDVWLPVKKPSAH